MNKICQSETDCSCKSAEKIKKPFKFKVRMANGIEIQCLRFCATEEEAHGQGLSGLPGAIVI